MANILTHLANGAIYFDNGTAGSSSVPALTGSAASLNYDGGAGLNITSYNTTSTDRFSVDGAGGRLFSVNDSLTGTIFSVNDAAGLPIIEVESTSSTDTITMGTYASNALVVAGNRVGIGTASPGSSYKLDVTGDVNINGDIVLGGKLDFSGNITAATSDTDTFLVVDAGELKTRTGAQVLSDIGALSSETVTSLALTSGSLVYTNESGTANSISLAAYLDEDSRSIASGSLNSTNGIVTFTRDDSTTFTLDLGDLLDDTNLVTSVAGKNGVVSLVKGDVGLGNVTNESKATMFTTPTFTGGGNTATLKKGTGNPALAFAGTSGEASALIEGIAGGGLQIYTSNGGTLSSPSWSTKMTIAAGGNTSFTGSVTATGLDINGAADISGHLEVGEYIFRSGQGSNYHRFLASQQIFVVGNASSIDLNNGVSTFGATSGATTLQGSSLLLDSAADITLDAGGQDIILSDDGTIFGTLSNSSGLQIRSRVDNADIYLRGVDGGTEFTALRLDMSAGGDATFAGNITALTGGGSGNITVGRNTNEKTVIDVGDQVNSITAYQDSDGNATHNFILNRVFDGTGANNFIIQKGGTAQFTLDTSANATFAGSVTATSFVKSGGSSSEFLKADGSVDSSTYVSTGALASYLPLAGGTITGNVRFNDSIKAEFGSGADLQINHDGTQSLIDNGTGNLTIQNQTNDGDIIFKSDDGSGGITPYLTLDGSSTGLTVSAPQGMVFFDSIQAKFGNNDDLQIYHDGSNSVLNNTTGNLQIYNNADDGDIQFISDNGAGGVAEYLRLDGGLGYSVSSQHLRIADGKALYAGDGNDLGIFHDGTNSYLENTTGHIYIRNLADDKSIIFQNDNGSGGYENYFELQGISGGADAFTVFPDTSTLVFGNGHDFKLRHNATDSYIENYTGDLKIAQYADDKAIRFYSDDGSGGLAEYLRLDGSLGYTVASKHILLNDGVKLRVGSSADLEIYHDGSNSYIDDTGTGDLYIRANNLRLSNADGSGQTINTNNGGNVELFYNNSKKFETTSTGVDIAGTINFGNGASTGNLSFGDSNQLQLGTGNDLRIYHNGSHSYVVNNTGDLEIINNTDDGDIKLVSDDGSGGTATYVSIDGGAVQTRFHKNTRHSDGVIALFGSGNDLQIFHDGSNSYIQDTGTGSLITNTDAFLLKSANNGEFMMTAYQDGAVNLFHNNTTRFSTTSTGVDVTGTITASGGGAAPSAPASASATIVGETVEVTFAASTTSNIDAYLVYSSIDGSDYGLISVVPPDDFAASMSIIDNAFDETGTQAYRVYASKLGKLSSATTASVSYTVSSAEPTTMSVVNLNSAYYVQWNPPSSNARFVTAYNVYKHEHATQGSLSRSSASLVYSGMNTNYMYQISGTNNNNFHQFWVETTIA